MKEVSIIQCDWCEKVSFSKKTILQHEKECLQNPENRGCGTCLWFSPLHMNLYQLEIESECYLGKIKNAKGGSCKRLLKHCSKWIGYHIWEFYNSIEKNLEMEEKLRSGDIKHFLKLEQKAMDYMQGKETLEEPPFA